MLDSLAFDYTTFSIFFRMFPHLVFFESRVSTVPTTLMQYGYHRFSTQQHDFQNNCSCIYSPLVSQYCTSYTYTLNKTITPNNGTTK